MKSLILALVLSVPLLSAASENVVRDARTGDELRTYCERVEAPGCQYVRIALFEKRTGEERVIAEFAVAEMTDPRAVLQIEEAIGKTRRFPITSGESGAIIVPIVGFVAFVSIPVLVVPALAGMSVASGSLLLFGVGTFPWTVMPVADLTSYPVRAIVQEIRRGKARRIEDRATRALQVLLSPERAEATVSHARFKQVAGAIETL